MRKLKDRFIAFYDDSYGMLITVIWILLIVCLIIKLFGGNWFELGTENEKFMNFCNFVEGKLPLKMFIACIINAVSCYPIYCIILNKKTLNLKEFLIFIPMTAIKSIVSWYNSTISFVIDLFMLLVPTTILNKNFKRTIICFALVNAFQIITILLRNLSFDFNTSNTVVENYLAQIDYYLMILLFYLYTFKTKNKKTEAK